MNKISFIISLSIILIVSVTTSSLANWQVGIEVSTPDPNSDTGIASNKIYVGTDSIATNGYDNMFDTIALLKGPIKAYLSHPEYPEGQQRLWRDFRPDIIPQEWEIVVQTEGDSTVNMMWTINAPDNLTFTLIDQDSNQEIAMKPANEYSYINAATTPKNFLLKISASTTTNSGGSAKGGGCGYIKNMEGKKNYSRQDTGNILFGMVILFMPTGFSLLRKFLVSSSTTFKK